MAAANNNTQGDNNGDVAQLFNRLDCLEQRIADIRLTLLERQVANIHLTLRNLAPRTASFNTTPFSPTAASPQAASIHFSPPALPFQHYTPVAQAAPLPVSIPLHATHTAPSQVTPAAQPPNNIIHAPIPKRQLPVATHLNPAPRATPSQPIQHPSSSTKHKAHENGCKDQDLEETDAIMEDVSAEKVEKVAMEEPHSQKSASLTLYDEKDIGRIEPQPAFHHQYQRPQTLHLTLRASFFNEVHIAPSVYALVLKTSALLNAEITQATLELLLLPHSVAADEMANAAETIPPKPPPIRLCENSRTSFSLKKG